MTQVLLQPASGHGALQSLTTGPVWAEPLSLETKKFLGNKCMNINFPKNGSINPLSHPKSVLHVSLPSGYKSVSLSLNSSNASGPNLPESFRGCCIRNWQRRGCDCSLATIYRPVTVFLGSISSRQNLASFVPMQEKRALHKTRYLGHS